MFMCWFECACTLRLAAVAGLNVHVNGRLYGDISFEACTLRLNPPPYWMYLELFMIGESRITQFYTYFLRCVFDSLEKTIRINTRFNYRVGSQTPAMSNKTGTYRMVLVLAELLECLQMLAELPVRSAAGVGRVTGVFYYSVIYHTNVSLCCVTVCCIPGSGDRSERCCV